MKYRVLGRTGVQVSQLCFGTMAFGGDADAAESARMFRAGRDAGINFFDTADQYNAGRSEEILGELIRGSRDDLVIATKCFNPTGTDVNARGANRRHVRRAVEASLKRLGTDRVDILFLHHYDALTPLEEHMRALEDVVRAGKVLYPAVSNYAAWQTQAALGHQERNGWARLQADPADVQPGQAPGRGRAAADGAGERGWRRRLQPLRRRPALRPLPTEGGARAATPRTRCTRCATARAGCTKPRPGSWIFAKKEISIR